MVKRTGKCQYLRCLLNVFWVFINEGEWETLSNEKIIIEDKEDIIKYAENIIKYEIIKREDLSEECFLNDLLSKAYEKRLIEDKEGEKIYFERLQSLQALLKDRKSVV